MIWCKVKSHRPGSTTIRAPPGRAKIGPEFVKPTTKGFTQSKYQLSFISKIPHDNGQVYGHFVFQNALSGFLQLHVISLALDVAFAGGQCLCHSKPFLDLSRLCH